MTTELRNSLETALGSGEFHAAVQSARMLLDSNPTARQWSHVRHAFEKAPELIERLKPMRVALLSSFSIEFVQDSLVAAGYLEGLRVEIYQSGFNQFRQEIMDPGSGLYGFEPNLAILAVELGQVSIELQQGYVEGGAGSAEQAPQSACDEMAALMREFTGRCSGTLLVHNFLPPDPPQLGILDGHAGTGQVEGVERLNSKLLELAREHQGVFILDYRSLVARFGSQQWRDPRMAHYAKLPISQSHFPELSREYAKFMRALAGRTRKCLVVDLDNTLWGGVLGEDGPDGIALGPDYPGSCFAEFQRAIRDLAKRGIVLAIASKNNRPDVEELFRRHAHMVLKEEDFACAEIHWEPKSQSLQRIATQLGLSLEHFVFVDDSAAECEQVRLAIPELTVIQLSKRPECYVDELMRGGWFDSLSLSGEDRKRTELYRQRAKAEQLKVASVSLEDYYAGLEMSVEIADVSDASLSRASQLTQKTNQFNLTTIRYTEAEVRARMGSPDWLLRTVRVRDKFGDNGIVGLLMAEQRDDSLAVDTFLLSCRVIGRTIESALIAHLCDQALRRGTRRIVGHVIPTPKNVPARDLYSRHGFSLDAELPNGESRWTLDAGESPVECPAWLDIALGDEMES